MKPQTKTLIFCLALCFASYATAQNPVTPESRTWLSMAIESPNPTPNSEFGYHTAILDYNGDGSPDLAVGAPGEGRVYVFEGPTFDNYWTINTPLVGGRFGHSLVGVSGPSGPDALAVANVNTNEAYLYAGSQLLITYSYPNAVDLYGRDMVADDLDGDGWDELIISAPTSGDMQVHWNALMGNGGLMTVLNGSNSPNGTFGHSMTTLDWNQDGYQDLAVSAPGNTSSKGEEDAGQVIIYMGPDLTVTDFVEDANPVPGDAQRFGMHIDGNGPFLGVATPREDYKGLWDAGRGRIFTMTSETRYAPVKPQWQGLFGYRVLIGNFEGNSALDCTFVALRDDLDARGFYVYDRMKKNDVYQVDDHEGSEHHYPQGAETGQLILGGRDEIILGDNTYTGQEFWSGRVVIYYR